LSLFVLDQRKRPVIPCCEKRARLLLERGRAVVHRRYRFTIFGKDRVRADVEPVRIKLDPGSRTTGIAVVADRDDNKPATVLCLFELAHRGRRGFQTGDMVPAEVPTGKTAGTHVGRVAVRGSGSLRVGNADPINAKSCKLLHRADGDCDARQPALAPRPEERGFHRGRP
jgi:hypothetical protein